MKLLTLGIINLHIFMITGQFVPVVIHYNQSSKIVVKRSARSAMNFDYAEQKCHGCQDENAGQCTRKNFLKVKRYTEQLKCVPEATLVVLQPPAPHYSVEPSMARINRCSGYCRHGFHTCLAVETSSVKIPVILRNHRLENAKCVEYELEQHEKCACDCEIRIEHCSERHKHEHCRCKCQNEAEKDQCLQDYSVHKKIWNEEKCECQCETESCSIGFVWDAKECRCSVITPSDMENLLY